MYNGKGTNLLSQDLFFVRGTTILLVVLFHVLGADASLGLRSLFLHSPVDLGAVTQFIDTFNMDVMFIGSGAAVCLFGRVDRTLWDFLTRKLNKLIIPVLVWAPIFLLVRALTKAKPHDWEGYAALLATVPAAWSPLFSIFWFVHSLIWCTFLYWLFQRITERNLLGRWDGPVYLGFALLLHMLAAQWNTRSPGKLIGTTEYFLYWNLFFGFGVLLHRHLEPLRVYLQKISSWKLAMIPPTLLLILYIHWRRYPELHLDGSYLLDGPMAFFMEFSMAVLVRHFFLEWSFLADWFHRKIVLIGSVSMIVYIFHIYFLSATRQLLEKLVPALPLFAHLVIGFAIGVAGPLVLLRALDRYRIFRWSVGLARVPSVKSILSPLPNKL